MAAFLHINDLQHQVNLLDLAVQKLEKKEDDYKKEIAELTEKNKQLTKKKKKMIEKIDDLKTTSTATAKTLARKTGLLEEKKVAYKQEVDKVNYNKDLVLKEQALTEKLEGQNAVLHSKVEWSTYANHIAVEAIMELTGKSKEEAVQVIYDGVRHDMMVDFRNPAMGLAPVAREAMAHLFEVKGEAIEDTYQRLEAAHQAKVQAMTAANVRVPALRLKKRRRTAVWRSV